MYIPANYEHRNAIGPDNNKFFRLWHTTFSDFEKIGASMLPQGGAGPGSTIGSDWNNGAYTAVSTSDITAQNFITQDDKGKWMAVVIYVKAATATSDLVIKIYKNGSLHLDASHFGDWEAGKQGYRYGYLLGWSNSGFTQDTSIYIDNLEFYDHDYMSGRPMPPSNLTIN